MLPEPQHIGTRSAAQGGTEHDRQGSLVDEFFAREISLAVSSLPQSDVDWSWPGASGELAAPAVFKRNLEEWGRIAIGSRT